MLKPQVLIVDDEPSVLQSIKRILRLADWDVVLESDSAKAMELINNEVFDVVIADYHMPALNGLDLLVASKNKHPNTVRILMTGDGDSDIVINAVNEGNIFKYISKPWNNTQLLDLVTAAVIQKQREDEKRELMKGILKEKSEWAEIIKNLEHRVVTLSGQGVQALLKVIQAKDMELYIHSLRVTWIADRIAECAGFAETDRQYLRLSALFHDIGKIAIRDNVLYKEGKLDDLERQQMNHHATVSADILMELDFMQDVAEIVRQHHERYDGKGYPKGLVGKRIHPSARVLTLADIFVALREKRAYKEGKTNSEALEIIRKEAGGALDPELTAMADEMLLTIVIPDLDELVKWAE